MCIRDRKLSKIAADNNIKIGSCAEKIDLDECGIIDVYKRQTVIHEKLAGFGTKKYFTPSSAPGRVTE